MQLCRIRYDSEKKAFYALGVEQKGVTQSIVKWCVDKMDECGYLGEKITVKSYQEESIMALKKAISAARIGETVPIESPVRASKSNGQIERCIRTFQGQVRTIKHYLESKIQKRMEVDSALYSWLVVYCADIMNKFLVGKDGLTAYERITAHKCKHFIIGFGEVVDYKLEYDKGDRHKADSDVHQGIFLGYAWRSTEYRIGTPNGI